LLCFFSFLLAFSSLFSLAWDDCPVVANLPKKGWYEMPVLDSCSGAQGLPSVTADM
jgi:hypothetical protein